MVENLGSELQVDLTIGGRSVTAILSPHSQATVGRQMRLHVDNEQMHLFDMDTGEAIF